MTNWCLSLGIVLDLDGPDVPMQHFINSSSPYYQHFLKISLQSICAFFNNYANSQTSNSCPVSRNNMQMKVCFVFGQISTVHTWIKNRKSDKARVKHCVPFPFDIFSLQQSRRSSPDRRLLTVIGCYLGGCQLKRQLNAFYASSVTLECQPCVVTADRVPGNLQSSDNMNKITDELTPTCIIVFGWCLSLSCLDCQLCAPTGFMSVYFSGSMCVPARA